MNIQGSGLGLSLRLTPAETTSNRSSTNNTPDYSNQLSTVSTNTTSASEESFSRCSSPDTIVPTDTEMSGSSPKCSSTALQDLLRFRRYSPIELLPPELITHVFSFLTDKENQWSTLLVCKSWYSATVDILWFRPNILHLPTLNLLLNTLDTPPSRLTLDYASLIRRVNLTNLAQTVDDSMLLRMQSCTKLERLTLAGCVKLSDDALVPLLQRNKGILSVDMTNLELVTDGTLTTLATNCRKLQGLYASGCKNITDQSVNALASNCPSLKRMKLNGCLHLNDGAIRNLISLCPLLVEFDVTGCSNITDETAHVAYMLLPQLREFRISLNMNITDRTLLALPQKAVFDKLRIMDFSGCGLITDEGVGRLVTIAPRLRNVVLAKCYNITDRGLLHLTKLGRNLHYMHLGHCNNITNTGISNLVKACNRIQYIDVACCNQLQDQAVREIAQLPKLRRVGLVKCQNISDQGIHAFTYRNGQENTLERIHLSYCTSISLSAITHLVNSCQRLTHLSLTGVPSFMREDLLQFCREPPAEFTQHQQQVFCVFSGQGVKRLRDHLNHLASEHRMDHRRPVSEYIAAHMDANALVGDNMPAFDVPLHLLTQQHAPDLDAPDHPYALQIARLPQHERDELARQLQTHRHILLLHEREHHAATIAGAAAGATAPGADVFAHNHGMPLLPPDELYTGLPTQNQFQEQMNLLNGEGIGPVNGARAPGRLRALMNVAQQLTAASQNRNGQGAVRGRAQEEVEQERTRQEDDDEGLEDQTDVDM